MTTSERVEILINAGFPGHEINLIFSSPDAFIQRFINAVLADGERELCASIEDF